MNGIQTGRHQAHNVPWEGRCQENRLDSSSRHDPDLGLGPKNCCGSEDMMPCLEAGRLGLVTRFAFASEMPRLKFDGEPFFALPRPKLLARQTPRRP
jgi:hypothetical protein